MMEILFRAKDSNIKGVGWVYGYYVKRKSPLGRFNHMIFSGDMDYDWTRESYFPTVEVRNHVEPTTIGMWTGLTDKNGVKVFVGDIVRCSQGCPHEVIFELEHGGTFVGGMPTFYLSGLGAGYAWTGEEEVIGNIYDNKLEDFQ